MRRKQKEKQLKSRTVDDIMIKLELHQAPNPSAGRVICPKEEVIS